MMNASTSNSAKDTRRVSVVSYNPSTNETPFNRTLKDHSKLFLHSSSKGVEIQDPSSLKHVYFVNTITLISPSKNDREEEHEVLLKE